MLILGVVSRSRQKAPLPEKYSYPMLKNSTNMYFGKDSLDKRFPPLQKKYNC